ncbi:MAG TPA: response regulator transcription factor [Candidatus Limnocylindrales bacterium]|nr:response regulator transcription factor [Candidatus Limnocylindrales bacterium]
MVAEAIPFREQIPVVVCAADPLSRAGIISQLRRVHGFSIASVDEPPDGAVALMVADGMSDEVAAELRALHGRGIARVVLLVARVDDRDLLAAVEAGVSGVIRRSEATAGNMAAAIRSAAAGEGTLSPDLLGRLLRQVGQLQRQVLSPRGLTFSGLTERETAVLRLLAQGFDTAEVGRRLFYSERTVKNIIHDVTSRLELRNRAHAVAYAIREGLI